MKPLYRLAIVFLVLGVIIAFVPKNTTKPYKLTAQQMLEEIQAGTQFISPDEVADKIIKKDPSIQLIDVRTPQEYDKFNLPGAINIPFHNILSEKYTEQFEQDSKMNILYCNGNTRSLEAWMLLRQLGISNIYILQGGLNYWAETIMNPTAPKPSTPDDTFAKYDFRKGAGMVLGGGNPAAVSNSASSAPTHAKTTITGAPKKKKGAAGGC